MLYAGEAPEITPPTLETPCIATGYQIVFGLKSETVSPSLKPYFLTKPVESHVVHFFTSW
jgi:hypothetical protein